MKFDLMFEKMILAKIMRNKKFAYSALRILKPENFSVNSLSYIYNITSDYINLYKKLPNKNVFKLELKKTKTLTITKKKQRFILVKQLFKISTFENYDYAFDKLKEFLEENNFIKALKISTDEYSETHNIKKAKEIITKEVIRSYDVDNYQISSYIDSWKERQDLRKWMKEHPKERIEISTGFPSLDKNGAKIKNGQLFAVIATTGKGKTTFLINIIYSAIKQDFKVLAIFPENLMSEIEQKFDSRFSGIFYQALSDCDYTKDEVERANERFELLNSCRKNNIRISTVIPETCNINVINTIWCDVVNKGFKPDLLVFDGADLMKPLKYYSEFRHEQTAVYWDIKNFILKNKIPGWISAQAKQEYASATKKATSEAFREAYAKASICDGIFSLNVSEQQYIDRKADLWVAKGRDFKDNYCVDLDVNRALMKMAEVK